MINYKLFTLGIEEEYMVIDPRSKELVSHEQKIVIEGQKLFSEKVKAEMHQAVVEVGTDVCANIDEARVDITNLRKTVKDIATGLGFSAGAAGTHPFSTWRQQLITDHIRYKEIVNETTGEVKKLPNSTTQLNKSEFSEMIERVKIWSAEWCNIYIPDAGEQMTIEL